MKIIKIVMAQMNVILFVFSIFPVFLHAQTDFDFNLDRIDLSELNSMEIPDAQVLPDPQKTLTEKSSEKEWTIMVYMNAKNDLEGFGIKDMNEMEAVGSTSKFNVVTELGRMKGHSSSDGDWTGARRYYVKADLSWTPWKIHSTVLMEIPKVNMGDYKHLVDFVNWAKNSFPAKRYMLIIWNHGSGWLKDFPVKDKKGISYDDETGNNIDTPQLGLALSKMGKIDILAMDACLMQMAEVAYEVKDNVDYVVASEETEPGNGYSYDVILRSILFRPDMTSVELGKVIVNAYGNSNIISIGKHGTQSLIDTKKLKYLTKFTDDFIGSLMSANLKSVVKSAREKTQKYVINDNKDFYHFVENIVKETDSNVIQSKGKILMNIIEDQVVIHNRTSLLPRSHSHGIAIYIPDGWYDRDYDELKWAKESAWDDFVKWQIKP